MHRIVRIKPYFQKKVQFIESLEAAKGKKWEHDENVSIREDVLCLTGFFNGDPWVLLFLTHLTTEDGTPRTLREGGNFFENRGKLNMIYL